MSEATLILPNMRGGCATVGTTVHTLFRLNGRRPGLHALAQQSASVEDARVGTTPSIDHSSGLSSSVDASRSGEQMSPPPNSSSAGG